MRFKRFLREVYSDALAAAHRRTKRGTSAYCPCCDSWQRSFRDQVMADRQCWVCGSLERHRLISILFALRPELLAPGREVLHIAPERMVARTLRRRARRYVSGDLNADFGPAKLDVLDLPFADSTFDVVVCNHVLEHVPDDRRAMREIRRVLRFDGWAMLLVPDVQRAETEETPGITDPEEMLRLYGQRDHVRRYGWDYVGRLRTAGFEPDVVKLGKVLTPEVARLCRLIKFGEIEPLFLAHAVGPQAAPEAGP